MTTVALALVASAVIGVSDYFGGRASERQDPALVTMYAQLTYLLVVPVLAVLVGWDEVTQRDLSFGLAGGVFVGLAYVVFFRALSTGRMGVAAPTTAAVSAVVPVLYDALSGTEMRPGRWVGVLVALVAVPVLAYVPSAPPDRSVPTGRVLGLSVLAGLGFAAFFLMLGQTSPASGQWPLVATTTSATITVALFVLVRRIPLRRPTAGAIASGATGAVAGACLTAALQRGPVSVATVLGSLYPVVTVALAARFAQERLHWWHVAGLAVAVAGAALVGAYA